MLANQTPLLLLATASSPYSVVISCVFYVNDGWVVVRSRYTCGVVEIENTEISEVTQILRNHLPRRSNDDVEGFHPFVPDFFSLFPRNIEAFLPNLIEIEVNRSQLTSVTADDLKPKFIKACTHSIRQSRLQLNFNFNFKELHIFSFYSANCFDSEGS